MDVKIAFDHIDAVADAAAAAIIAIAESVEADKIACAASAAAKAAVEKAAAFTAISAEYEWASAWSKSVDALVEIEEAGALSVDRRLEAYRMKIAACDKLVLFVKQEMLKKDEKIFDLEKEKAELKANFNRNKWTALESVLQKEMANWPDQKAMKEELTKLRLKIESLESKVKTLAKCPPASFLVETFTLVADRAKKLMEESLEEESSEEDK